MKLIVSTSNTHVSNDTVTEFENEILSSAECVVAFKPRFLSFSFFVILYRVLRKLGIYSIFSTAKCYLKHPLKDKKHLFSIMMGLDEYKYRPYGIYTFHCRSIYLFDAWPHDFDKIIDFVVNYKVDYVFVSASQSKSLLNKNIEKKIFHWIPEGIQPEEYDFFEYSNKTIDVLALGRKYDLYHDLIVDSLAEKGYTYLYELKKGELIFPTRQDFIEGLAKTKISICVPSSITHPERSGDIETMTIRYLQSMVSKCLIVGHAPKEMIDLFGYNPVIEINMSDPGGQIDAILKDFDTYIPLIEQNYQQVLQHHTWTNRWNQMKNIWSNQSK